MARTEAPVEVVLSRVLSAVGYHQPPVYYRPAFTVADDWGTRVESGGRFRLTDKTLKERGEWSWQENPFVGTTPYQGLLVILRMFNSSDLKNSNNTRYEHRVGDSVESFRYDGWHQGLFRARIATQDVRWASELLSRLSDRQGDDAFAAGGYPPATAQRFIREIHARIAEGRRLGRAQTLGDSQEGSS